MKTKTILFALLLCTALGTTFAFATENIQEPSIIELLQDGESYSIEITSIGCFNGTRQTVTVILEDGLFKASFQDSVKILTQAEIEAFIDFEFRLRGLSIGGCSTVDTYVLRYAGAEFRTSDGTCSWNGGSKLLQIFS